MAEPDRRPLARYLLRGGIVALVGRMASLLGGVMVSVLVVRLLPPDQVGLLFLIFTVVTVATTVGQLGLPRTLVRLQGRYLMAGNPAGAYSVARSALILALLGGLAVCAFLAAGPGVSLIRLLGSQATEKVMVLAGLLALGRVMESMAGETFRGFQQVGRAVVFGSLVSSTLLIAGLLTLFVLERYGRGWKVGIHHVLALTVTAAVLAAIVGLGILRWQSRDLSPKDVPGWPALLRMSWPILGTTLLAIVWTSLGIWILSSITRDESALALYGTAQRVASLVGIPLAVGNAVLMPVIAQLYAGGRRRELTALLRFSATVAFLPALVGFLILLLEGESLLGLVFGPFYGGAALLLSILALSQLLDVSTGSCGLTLLMAGRQGIHFFLNVLSLGFFVVAGVVLTRQLGALGMAVATFLGSLIRQSVFVATARWKTGIWTCATLDPRKLSRYRRVVPLLDGTGSRHDETIP